jgi:hypothetical protein
VIEQFLRAHLRINAEILRQVAECLAEERLDDVVRKQKLGGYSGGCSASASPSRSSAIRS